MQSELWDRLSSRPVTAGGLQHPLNPELDKKTDGGMGGWSQTENL